MNKSQASHGMTTYPLYYFLLDRVKSKNENNLDISMICMTINDLTLMEEKDAKSHYQEIYKLILYHELVSNENILFSKIPNEGKSLPGEKILYTFNKLPVLFRQILHEYILYYS